MSAKENTITSGAIWKQLLLFFFPILIGTFFQQLYNTVDAVIVGQFVGKEALSSVGGSAGQIINLVVGFFTGLSAGATVLISQYFGAKKEQDIEEALHTAYAIAVTGGIVLGVLGIGMTGWLLQFMDTPQRLVANSTLYLRIYFGGLVFVFLYNMGAAILRAVGDSKRPLYYLILCCAVNIILDLILILAFDLGVLGAALATLIAQAVSAGMVTVTLMCKTEGMKLQLKKIRLQKKQMKDMLRIGLPTGFQASMYNVSNLIVQTALNGFGVNTMAAWTIFGKIDSLFWMVDAAFEIAITTFVGQNYGAGKWDRVKKGTWVCLGMGLGSAAVLSVIFYVGGGTFFRIFTADPSVIEIGVRQMRMITPTYFLFVFIEIFSGSLRAQGHVTLTTLVTILGICLFRVVWVGWLVPNGTMEEVIACYPITWLMCAVVVTAYYLYRQKLIYKTPVVNSKNMIK